VVPPKEKLAKFGYNQKKKLQFFWNTIFWLHPRSYGLNRANSAFLPQNMALTSLKKKKTLL
jgi:hypothetical protein